MPFLLLLVLAVGAPGQSSPADRVPTYCVAAFEKSGFVDGRMKDRQDSAADLAKALADSKDVVVVSSADQASVIVEIVDRSTNRTSRRVYDKTGGHYVEDTTYFVKARLRVGTYEVPLEGKTGTGYGSWRLAAGSLGDAVEKWVRQNRARLSEPAAAARNVEVPSALRATPKGARQQAMDWLLASLEDAPKYLVASGREQVTAFRDRVRDQPSLAATLTRVVAPAASFRSQGSKVTATGQTIALSSTLSITLEPEAVSGDRALVPLSVKAGDRTARGSIELTREDGVWRIAAADLGPQARWPRFDSPAFISELGDRVASRTPR